MPTIPQLPELLLRWEELREQGQEATPEELCRDCPEHLDELRKRIAALQAMDEHLQLTTDESVERSLQSTIDHESADTGAEKFAGDCPLPQTGAATPLCGHTPRAAWAKS